MNEEILQNINHRIDDALEYGRQVVEDDELVERLERLRAQSENYIRKHPLKSVGIGLFAGYVLGKIFSSED